MIGWRAIHTRNSLPSGEHAWCLISPHAPRRTFDTMADIVYAIACGISKCWSATVASERLADMLDDPQHVHHSAAWAWYRRQDDNAEMEAWLLVDPKPFHTNEPPPDVWDNAAFDRLVVYSRFEGTLLRGVAAKRAARSAQRLTRALAWSQPQHRQRVRL